MEDKEYARNHYRVRAAFGRASEYQCVLCFDPAVDWSWQWRTHPDPSDPNSYAPLCRADHRDYDFNDHYLLLRRNSDVVYDAEREWAARIMSNRTPEMIERARALGNDTN